jgi:hypothetical protein
VSNPAGKAAMIDGPLRRLFWRVADALAYVLTLAWLRILDALAGPELETTADRQRDRNRAKRLRPNKHNAAIRTALAERKSERANR